MIAKRELCPVDKPYIECVDIGVYQERFGAFNTHARNITENEYWRKIQSGNYTKTELPSRIHTPQGSVPKHIYIKTA